MSDLSIHIDPSKYSILGIEGKLLTWQDITLEELDKLHANMMVATDIVGREVESRKFAEEEIKMKRFRELQKEMHKLADELDYDLEIRVNIPE